MRKKLLSLILIFCLVLGIGLDSIIYAIPISLVPNQTLKIIPMYDGTIGYEIGGKKVWNIICNTLGDTTYHNSIFYCLKHGVGFGGVGTPAADAVGTYDTALELRDTSDMVPTVFDTTNTHNAVLWILDNMYDRHYDGTAAEKATMKRLLLEDAGLTLATGNSEDTELTDLDIEAIQRYAIWHFTDLAGDGVTPVYNFGAVRETTDGSYYDTGSFALLAGDKQDDAKKLFDYLVAKAASAGSIYGTTGNKTNKRPVSKVATTPTIETQGTNYVAGPFKIQEEHTNILYDLTYTIKNQSNGTITGAKLTSDATGNTVITKITPGQNFYVSYPTSTTGVTSVKVDVGIMYFEVKDGAKAWVHSNNSEQPVALVEKVKAPYTLEMEASIVPSFELEIIKEDSVTHAKMPGVKFTISADKTVTNLPSAEQTTDSNGKITIPNLDNVTGNIKFTITEIATITGYELLENPIEFTINRTAAGVITKVSGADITITGNKISITIENEKIKYFDLALRKYITKVNDVPVTVSRDPVVDETALAAGTSTTATYKHKKDPVQVMPGDKVIYKITVYNEGDIAGRAIEITDQLPTGLEFVRVVSGDYVATTPVVGNKLILTKVGTTDIPAYTGSGEPSSETVEIECEVTATVSQTRQILTNIAWISEDSAITPTDRDSQPGTHPTKTDPELPDYKGNTTNKDQLSDEEYHYKGEQDDDDFEKLTIPGQEFDLALRKYITKVNDDPVAVSRDPDIDETALSAGSSTTATYKHKKDPVQVMPGDIVTYKITIYNEGDIAGRAIEITDQLPTGLEFVRVVSGDYVATTPVVGNKLILTKVGTTDIPAYTGAGEPSSETVEIECEVTATVSQTRQILTNIAWISEDSATTPIDRDSEPTTHPTKTDPELPDYKGNTTNKEQLDDEEYHYKGEQDDDDFEKLIIPGQEFDLALRKYIEYVDGIAPSPSREPNPKTSAQSDRDIFYEHDKTPIVVERNNIITYTIRVYNEGDIDGTAEEITDHLPEGVEYIADDPVNLKYGWKTRVVNGKTEYYTDYWSRAKASSRTIDTDPIIKARDLSETLPNGLDSRYVQIVCRVTFVATKITDTTKILRNVAEITEDWNPEGIPDKDSIPTSDEGDYNYTDYTDEDQYDNEDDVDFEQIRVKYFDLALRKWVTEAIVTVDGKTTTTPTGNKAEDNPEAPAHVQLDGSKLDRTVVKFKYSIRVTNEGEIAGYAKEVKDHIPAGLAFDPNDQINKDNGWKAINESTIYTEKLANTLLQPGQSVEIEVMLTWINNPSNMGIKINTAEISEHKNNSDTPDIDSQPDNWKPDRPFQDDEDDAPVLLEIETGTSGMYVALPAVMMMMLATGTIFIKKRVLI